METVEITIAFCECVCVCVSVCLCVCVCVCACAPCVRHDRKQPACQFFRDELCKLYTKRSNNFRKEEFQDFTFCLVNNVVIFYVIDMATQRIRH
jgi:hypothetical protein